MGRPLNGRDVALGLMFLGGLFLALVPLTFDLLDLGRDMVSPAIVSLVAGALVGVFLRAVLIRMDERRTQTRPMSGWLAWLIGLVVAAVVVALSVTGQASFVVYGILVGFFTVQVLVNLFSRRS